MSWIKKQMRSSYGLGILVFLVSIFNRLIFKAAVSGFGQIGAIGLDSAYYHRAASHFSETGGFSSAFFMSPLYLSVLGVLYSVFGAIPEVGVIANFIFGALTAVLIFRIGAKILNPMVGILGAVLYNLYGFSLFLENHLLLAPLVTFLFTLFSYLSILAVEHRRPYLFVLTGLVGGWAALGRGSFLIVLVFAGLAYLMLVRRRDLKSGLITLSSFFLGVVLALIPVAMHNYRTGGEFVLISSNGGINYFIGNCESANGTFVRVPGVEFFQPGSPPDGGSIEVASQRAGRVLTPAEASAFWIRQGLQWNRDNVDRTFALYGRKLLFAFIDYEIPQIENFSLARTEAPPVRAWIVSFGILAGFGIGGAILFWRESAFCRQITILILIHTLSLLPFFMTARYRFPVSPLLSVLAGLFLWGLFKRIRWSKPEKSLPILLTTGAAIFVFFSSTPEFVQASAARLENYNRGMVAFKEGRLAEAVGHFENSVRLYPDHIPSRANLGTLYMHFEHYDKAIQEFEFVLEADPTNLAILPNYLICLEKMGMDRKAEKVRQYLQSVSGRP